MQSSYQLPLSLRPASAYLSATVHAAFLPPQPTPVSPLLRSDPALHAMNDFSRQLPPTVEGDAMVDARLKRLFRRGVRAFVVMRDRIVQGLITQDRVRQVAGKALPASALMIPMVDCAAIDWTVLQESRVSDLMEIFEGTGVDHLVVLDTQKPSLTCVRGVILRRHLMRQLRCHRQVRP